MQELKIFFQSKRNVVGLIVFLILILAIPLGIYLVKTTQIFAPKAEETGSIVLAEGNCVTTINGDKVLTCKEVPLRLVAPSFNESSPSPSPSPSSSPSPSPVVAHKRVFVTSSTYSGDLGGLEGADQECQFAAESGDLEGVWKAWLSGDIADAASRLTKSSGQYRLVDGTTVVAQNWTDLTDGTLLNPIKMDEFKNTLGDINAIVWTNSYPSGTKKGSSCNNWTDKSSAFNGSYGNYTTINSWWTEAQSPTTFPCDDDRERLYCFEQ